MSGGLGSAQARPDFDAPRSGILPSHRWAVVFASVGALLVVAFAAFAILIAGPPSAANLASTTSDGVEAERLATPVAEAGVVVPEGWVVVRDGDADVVALTPDGAMKVRIVLTEGSAEALVIRTDGRVGDPREEQLASRLPVVHADLDDGGIVAAMDVAGGVVVLQSELLADVDPAIYRPAFAELLEGVRP